jgi:glycosyltransferase involved in cell wall biosynthesis
MIRFSIILPCFNEAENIPEILERFGHLISYSDTELILVNNGSFDNTALILEKYLPKYTFARQVDVAKNKGYGYGIMQGLKSAKGNWIGWSHADLQTDVADIIKAIDICRNFSDSELGFVKGARTGRSFIARLFSKGMEFFVRIILKESLVEINAQPNIFNIKLLTFVENPPNHWGLDLFFYYVASKSSFKFVRIPVLFPERKYGKSKWNNGLFSRIGLSIKMLRYCFEIKRKKLC